MYWWIKIFTIFIPLQSSFLTIKALLNCCSILLRKFWQNEFLIYITVDSSHLTWRKKKIIHSQVLLMFWSLWFILLIIVYAFHCFLIIGKYPIVNIKVNSFKLARVWLKFAQHSLLECHCLKQHLSCLKMKESCIWKISQYIKPLGTAPVPTCYLPWVTSLPLTASSTKGFLIQVPHLSQKRRWTLQIHSKPSNGLQCWILA